MKARIHLVLQVADIAAARAFYRDVVGLGEPVMNSNVWVEFKLDGTAAEALQQIKDRGYAKAYEADSRPKYLVGASFSSKTGTIEEWQNE